jgi:hypothetical protein
MHRRFSGCQCSVPPTGRSDERALRVALVQRPERVPGGSNRFLARDLSKRRARRRVPSGQGPTLADCGRNPGFKVEGSIEPSVALHASDAQPPRPANGTVSNAANHRPIGKYPPLAAVWPIGRGFRNVVFLSCRLPGPLAEIPKRLSSSSLPPSLRAAARRLSLSKGTVDGGALARRQSRFGGPRPYDPAGKQHRWALWVGGPIWIASAAA